MLQLEKNIKKLSILNLCLSCFPLDNYNYSTLYNLNLSVHSHKFNLNTISKHQSVYS